jgi:hypothetical protein
MFECSLGRSLVEAFLVGDIDGIEELAMADEILNVP